MNKDKKSKLNVDPEKINVQVLYGALSVEKLDLDHVQQNYDDYAVKKYDVKPQRNRSTLLYGSPIVTKYDIKPENNIDDMIDLYGAPMYFKKRDYSWKESFYGNVELLKTKVLVILGSNALNIKKDEVMLNKHCLNCWRINVCNTKWSDFIEEEDWKRLNNFWDVGFTLLWIQPTPRLLKEITNRFNERCVFYYGLSSLIPEELKNNNNYCAYWIEPNILGKESIENNDCPYDLCNIDVQKRDQFALSKPNWYITFVDKHQIWYKNIIDEFNHMLKMHDKSRVFFFKAIPNH